MSECRCGRETRDDAYVCEDCGDSLARALGDVPWLVEQLDISVTGQKGVDYRRVGGSKGGKKASERPSPVSWGPSEARAHLRALLVSWVKFAHETEVTSRGRACTCDNESGPSRGARTPQQGPDHRPAQSGRG